MSESATLTIYIPRKHQTNHIISRLKKLAKQHDRSVNYLAVQALVEFLDTEEGNA